MRNVKLKRAVSVIASILMLLGCSNAVDEYSSISCYVIIYNDLHLNSVLNSATNSMTPGIFCEIRSTTYEGVTAFSLNTSDGQEDYIKLTTDKERRATRIVGRNNGIIVGFSSLGNGFYAYDRECPNCYTTGRSHPLTLQTNGQAKCTNCNRAYDLNNRGFIASGDDGEPLTRYRASTSGPNGVLVVQNN